MPGSAVRPGFYRAVGHVFRSRIIKVPSEDERKALLHEPEALFLDFDRDGDIASDNPVSGARIKKPYTAIAHFYVDHRVTAR